MAKITISFLRNDRGATAIEYGLIAAMIAVAILVGVKNFASSTGTMYDNISTTVTTIVG
jgi:pilus assembly protein Flp/PilA